METSTIATGETPASALSELLCVLENRGYKHYGKDSLHGRSELWQRKLQEGCYLSVFIYPARPHYPFVGVEAEVTFECGPKGMWCKHKMYGVRLEEFAERLPDMEEQAGTVYDLLEGYEYA